MSTILDALRKAKEGERKSAAAEPRREILSSRTHDYLATFNSPDEERVRLLRWLLVGVAVAIVLLAALLTLVLMRMGGGRESGKAASRGMAPTPVAAIVAPPPTPAGAAVTSIPAPAVVSATPAPTPAGTAAASPAPTTQPSVTEVRLVLVPGTATPSPTPATVAPPATPAPSTAPASTLPPPLTGLGADELPQPVPIGPSRTPLSASRTESNGAAPLGNAPAGILASMKLDGIIYDKRDPVAMINGQIVRPGATLGKAKVVRIERDAVIVRIDGEEYSLGQ